MTRSRRLERQKRALRADSKSRRDSLAPQERALKSAAIGEGLLALPELRAARKVMLFSSFGSEVETAAMIERLAAIGKELALPRVEGGDILAVAYRPGDPVREAWFGAEEPLGARILTPAQVDIVVTPGLAFDRRGHRVGYGGGFYDRFLRQVRADAFKVAVAFHLQVVDEVPSRGDEVPVDAIVTELETIRCS